MLIPKIRKWRIQFLLAGATVAEGVFSAMFAALARDEAEMALRFQNDRVRAGEIPGVVVENYDTVSMTAL